MTFQPKSATILEGRYVWAQYAPHLSLASWVSSYWTLSTEGPHVVRTLPDACIDLTLHLSHLPDASRTACAYVAAAQREARSWSSDERVSLLGARLFPGASAMLGIDVESLEDGWNPLDSLLPRTIVSRLERGVARASNVHDRIACLDAFFSERFFNREIDLRLTLALREAFARRGDISVTELARIAGAHPRTLTRLFDRHVGLSPKRFVRIVRLQSALRALPESESWAQAAIELGYFDQAHFIREVRELFGCTPREVMRLSKQTL